VKLDASVATTINKYGAVGGADIDPYKQAYPATNGHDVMFGSYPQTEQWSQ